MRYHVTPHRRGAYCLGAHWIRHRSPLGLWIRQLQIPAENPVRIYPDVQGVRSYDLLARNNRELELVRATRLTGGDSEFECLDIEPAQLTPALVSRYLEIKVRHLL